MSRGALPLAGLEVHQLLPTFTPGDAMGAAAIGFSRALRLQGALGWVYAGERAAQYGALVRPASELRPAPDALVLYHHGIASLLSGRLAHLNCRRGVVFHNVTPARFYEGTRLEEPLRAGRAQLAAMAKSVDVSLGVSQYNVRELEVAGHSNVHRVPLFLEPARFSAAAADARLRTRLVAGGRPVVVSVSRVVPHKRAEDVLSLHAELRRLAPEARLVIIGAYAPGQKPFRALARRAKAIGGVSLLGHVSHAELVAAYRSADVFVSMSEHEGFGVPLLEAMACEVPVLAFGASAVPETMGGAGLVFDEKHFAALAEVVMLLQHDTAMREAVVAGQRARVAQFSLEATSAALANALKEFAPKPKALPRRKRPKVAVVVQRYGPDITGGAEAHARQVVERLAEHVEVEVLTTCATDHFTWANELPEGLELDGGTRVERFAVTRTRKMLGFNRLSDSLFGQSLEAVAEERWLCEQGPLAPGLLEALRTRGTSWNAAIFFTYLYQPTAWGVPLVGDRALVVPTAHDEPPFRFEIFGDALTHAQALLCNTPEEEALIRGRFPHAARSRVVGVGIEPGKGNGTRFRQNFGVSGPYLLYLGRLEAGKGVDQLLEMHGQLVREFHDAPTLVLAGTGALTPRGARVKAVGRISEEDKWDALAGALAVVVPSRYESLSLVTLEAFSVGTPVLGNSASDVVAGQCTRSGAGLTWRDTASFIEAVRTVGAKRPALSAKAKPYAKKHSWEKVVSAYLEEIDRLRGRAR